MCYSTYIYLIHPRKNARSSHAQLHVACQIDWLPLVHMWTTWPLYTYPCKFISFSDPSEQGRFFFSLGSDISFFLFVRVLVCIIAVGESLFQFLLPFFLLNCRWVYIVLCLKYVVLVATLKRSMIHTPRVCRVAVAPSTHSVVCVTFGRQILGN